MSLMPLSLRSNRNVGYGAAVVVSLLALDLTYMVPVFTALPWALSFLAVAVVAWLAGAGPALLVILIDFVGIYWLVFRVSPSPPDQPGAFIRAAGFIVVALFIIYLLRQRTVAKGSLESSEMHYRSVTDTAMDVIVTIDAESTILSINPAVKTVFGHEPEHLIGKQLMDLMPERFRATHLAGIEHFLRTEERTISWTAVQLTGLRRDGQEIPLEISFGSYLADGKRRFTGFIRDVSERRQTQAALMQSEKLAVVGRLASSIAHEINNPLEAVMNLLYLARGSDDTDESQSYLETAEREIRRISVITHQTLQFHKQTSDLGPVDFDALTASSLVLFQGRLINGQITVEQRHRAQTPVLCIEGDIRQVLNNLIGNAIDALPPRKGRILIRSRDATNWKTGRRGVHLTVADTGSGMDAQTQAKIFEPFFSTKGISGVGLGLWVCLQLVEKNRGRLRVRSSQMEGHSGTVFTMFVDHLDDPTAS